MVKQIHFNLLFRWFVGLVIIDRVRDHCSFGQKCKRLFDEGMARRLTA